MTQPLDIYLGPAAGIATSILWTATSLSFTAAARRIGATLVNSLRIFMAAVLLGITHRLIFHTWVPHAADSQQIVFLAISGLLGLSIGDQALFISYVDIGPRLAMLVMATSPILAALFAWAALGEELGPWALAGIALTVGGVAWVVLERPGATRAMAPSHRVRGLTLALVAAIFQAGGYLLSKKGIGHGWLPKAQHLDPQAAAFVRMFFASLGMLPILAFRQFRRRNGGDRTLQPARKGSLREGLLLTGCGAVVGPFLGMWLSLVAADRAPLGVAQTLLSLPPILILPFAYFIHKETIGARAILGALLAVGGATVLFFAPR